MDLNINSTSDNQNKNNEKRRKFWLVLASIIFILLFIAYGVYWFMVLRFQEYTDDAYVSGVQVPIIAQTNGNVTQINYENTDLVKAGDVLVILDKTNAQLSYEQAKHELANAVRQTQERYINNDEYKAEIRKNEISLSQAQKIISVVRLWGKKEQFPKKIYSMLKKPYSLLRLH